MRGPGVRPEEAAAALRQLEQEKREAELKLPDYSKTQLQQPAARAGRTTLGVVAHASPLPVMPLQMPCVSIGRSMWPLPVGSNPNSHGCEVVVAKPLPA